MKALIWTALVFGALCFADKTELDPKIPVIVEGDHYKGGWDDHSAKTPEPGTVLMCAAGLGFVLMARRGVRQHRH